MGQISIRLYLGRVPLWLFCCAPFGFRGILRPPRSASSTCLWARLRGLPCASSAPRTQAGLATKTITVHALGLLAAAVPGLASENKLLKMYELHYLPFSIEFQEGRHPEEILPLIPDGKGGKKVIKAETLRELDDQYTRIRKEWRAKSLLLSHETTEGTVQVFPRVVSHRLRVTRGPLEQIPLAERIETQRQIQSLAAGSQLAALRLKWAWTLLEPLDRERPNLFVLSASWCKSCEDYRVLLETYLKTLGVKEFALHSVLLDDPGQKIFEKGLLKELFPKPQWESIPRFLLYLPESQTGLLEEGDALEWILSRSLRRHRGFCDAKVPLFSKTTRRSTPLLRPAQKPE